MPNAATFPAVMSPEWCSGLQRAVNTIIASAKRDNSEATAAAHAILSAASVACNQPIQEARGSAWTGDSALRLWGKACDDLCALMTPEDERARVLRGKDLAILARLPMQFLEVAARFYAEVAPALLDNATGPDRIEVVACIQLQEFLLNYVITPAAIDAHQKLARIMDNIRPGNAAFVTHEEQLSIVEQVAGFAQALCKLAKQHGPGSNPYAGLVAEEFTAGHQRVARATERC